MVAEDQLSAALGARRERHGLLEVKVNLRRAEDGDRGILPVGLGSWSTTRPQYHGHLETIRFDPLVYFPVLRSRALSAKADETVIV